MSFVLPLLLFLILAACVGFLFRDGMWANAIRLINVVTSALLATNYFEPLAKMLDENVNSSFTYFWDFISLWLLFGVFLMIFRTLTAFASRVKVRFLGVVDRVGSGFFALCIGWVMVCFTTMTLHTAPLAESFLFGGFRPKERMFLGLAPDRQWLGFMQRMSRGSFSRSAGEEEREGYPPREDASEREQKLAVFDGRIQFIDNYAGRRAALEAHVESKATGPRSVLVSQGSAPER